jgi:hypothetical protein
VQALTGERSFTLVFPKHPTTQNNSSLPEAKWEEKEEENTTGILIHDLKQRTLPDFLS